MKHAPIFRSLTILCLSLPIMAAAQAPGVPIMRDRGGPARGLIEAAEAARNDGKLLSQEQVIEQMKRQHFTTSLPKPNSVPLHSRTIWQKARDAHVRVGWHYLCNRCDNWHQSLAGGFFINPYGLVATCEHVINPSERDYREGYLIAASDDGTFYPVVEVLAAHAPTDAAILRVAVDKPVPFLPLNVNAYPGDDAWCYSYPLRRAGYFSHGIVNRFHYEQKNGVEVARLAVTTDWAPGSSGSAVIDTYGNAIGMVSTISPAGTGRPRSIRRQGGDETQDILSDPTAIIFRTASRAADIIALTQTHRQANRTRQIEEAVEKEEAEDKESPEDPDTEEKQEDPDDEDTPESEEEDEEVPPEE